MGEHKFCSGDEFVDQSSSSSTFMQVYRSNYETQKSSDIELDTTTQAEPCTLAFQQTVEKKYVLNTIKMSPQ